MCTIFRTKPAEFTSEEYKRMIDFLEECMSMISTLLSSFRFRNLLVGIACVTTQILLVDKVSQNLASKHKHQLFLSLWKAREALPERTNPIPLKTEQPPKRRGSLSKIRRHYKFPYLVAQTFKSQQLPGSNPLPDFDSLESPDSMQNTMTNTRSATQSKHLAQSDPKE